MAKPASATPASARIAPAPYAKSAAERLRILLIQCGMTVPYAWGAAGTDWTMDIAQGPSPHSDPGTTDSPLSVFKRWMNSGDALPVNAERFEAAARTELAQAGVSAKRLALFAQDDTPESDFLKHAMHLFMGGHSDFRAWGATKLAEIDDIGNSRPQRDYVAEISQRRGKYSLGALAIAQKHRLPPGEAELPPPGLNRPLDRMAYLRGPGYGSLQDIAYDLEYDLERRDPPRTPAHVFFGNVRFVISDTVSAEQIEAFNALSREEQTQRVAAQNDWRLNGALLLGQTRELAPAPFSAGSVHLNAFRALADAALDSAFLSNPDHWAIGSAVRAKTSALQWIGACHRMALGEYSIAGDAEIKAPIRALSTAISELGLNSETFHFDAEVVEWLENEANSSRRLDSLAASHAWTLCLRAPSQARAFLTHLRKRLESPLQFLPEEPALEEAFPDWIPPPVPGASAAAQNVRAADDTGAPLGREAVEAQAREMGPLGELAVQAARVFGLSATNANALVGVARNALLSEAGWTAGVWRLAANSPEFARSCAHALEAQAAQIQGKRRALLRKGVFNGDEKFGAIQEIDSLNPRLASASSLAEEKKEFKNWLKKKKLALLGAKPSRALMALGQAAMVRNGDHSAFAGVAECLAAQPDDHYGLGKNRSWLVDILAGCAPDLNIRDAGLENAIHQALQEQQAATALAPAWAAALAEGWASKARALGSPPSLKGEKSAENDGGSDATEYNRWVGKHFVEDLNELRDCVQDTPGFMQTLPKKFNWGFLMGVQQRWHDERARAEFANSGSASLSWPAVAIEFSAGGFTATPLVDARALFDEGKAMRHCVFSYTDRCHTGHERIVSIQRAGQRVSTLEIFPRDAHGRPIALIADGSNAADVHSWEIGQNHGPCNARIRDPEVLAFCEAYLRHMAEHAKNLRDDARENALLSLSGKAPRPKSGLPADDAGAPAAGRRPNRGM